MSILKLQCLHHLDYLLYLVQMEQSTLHIKAPHHIHIAAKAMAMSTGTSMNQFVVDLIKAEMDRQGWTEEEAIEGINTYRRIFKGKQIFEKEKVSKQPKVAETKKEVSQRITTGVCKHGYAAAMCKFEACRKKGK